MTRDATVFVVDDDPSIRRALGRLLGSRGFQVEAFATAQSFLEHERPPTRACLVLDVNMPGLDGLELQRNLNETNVKLPIVFISGHGDIPMTVRAMKGGASDFLTKPFDEQVLLKAIRQALERDEHSHQERADCAALRKRAESLTAREREVFALVVTGMLNKQVGRRLGVTEKTVKVHRAQAMHKMQARSLAELVRMAERVGIALPH